MFENIKYTDRLSYLFGGFALIILFISFIYYVATNLFQIHKIRISGNVSKLTPDVVSNMARNRLSGTFFTLDIDVIQKEFERLDWVKEVKVNRVFPDTINVDVVEYVAIANLGNNKLLANDNKIFNGVDTTGKLPLFIVPDNQISKILEIYKSIDFFTKEHNLVTQSIMYNGLGLTKFVFTNGLNITICGDLVLSEMKLLNKYWSRLEQIESNFISVNMCYKDALAIK